MSSKKSEDPPEDVASPVDLLSGEADTEIAAAAKTDSFTIDDDDNRGEEDDVPTPLKASPGIQKPSKSGAKMAKLSDKTSKIMNDYQAYLQEIETEFPSGSVASGSPVDQVKESIRVGYRDNIAASSNLPSITKDYNPPSDTPLRRGWDHGDDEEEGSLNLRDHLVTRGQKYTHPLLHSRRFKKAICCTALSVVAVVIIGVSVSQKKKNANLPDWEGEYAAIEEKEKEGQMQEDAVPTTEVEFTRDELLAYEDTGEFYQPVFFERSTDTNYPDGSYLEALEFCGRKEGYALCPFGAICPLGPGRDPIRGVVQGGPSWNPLADRVDDWVQLAADGKCTLYSQYNAEPPEWGTKGGNTDATRNLVCCYSGVTPPVATSTDSDITSTSTENVALIEFDRSKDWTGQTYGQAVDFCGQKGYSICSYDAICPDGNERPPSSGLKPGPDGQWAPISDEIHDWVQVGSDIPCTRWFSRHPGPPIWSETGEDNEEITRYIYCCSGGKVVATAATPPTTLSTTIATVATSPATLVTTTQTPIDSQNTQVGVPPSNIQWFDRSTGYKGQTYTEAVLFCIDQKALPCTFQDICPSGDGTIPNGGYRVPSGESWVPIKESVELQDDNAWVSVSAENACARYDRLHTAPPVWGSTGEGNEEITRNVACCQESRSPTNQPTPIAMPEADFIELAIEDFDPVWYDRSTGWLGQTYLAAEQFCHFESRVLCPMMAVCPDQPGAENLPIGGVKDGVAWVPLDSDNEWLQVGQEDSCISYASLYKHNPDWGLTGDDNESITRHIVCCRDDSAPLPMDSATDESAPLSTDSATDGATDESAPSSTDSAPPSTETSDMWSNLAVELFQPQWHTAAEGYAPSTHFNAQLHCIENGQVLCPIMAYCPTGDKAPSGGSPLLLGMERFPGEVWAPLGEGLDFVQIGAFEDDETTTCKSLSQLNNGKLPSDLPKLGDVILCCQGGLGDPTMPCGDGLVNDGVCSGIDELCCSKNGFCADCDRVSLLDVDDVGVAGNANLSNVNSGQDTDANLSNVNSEQDTDANLSNVNSGQDTDFTDPVVEAGRKYEPVWLGREHDWTGGSYDDAVNLCIKFNGNLCPYEAYCPLGAKAAAFPNAPGAFDPNDEHYSPVADVENAWVNVGKKEGDSATSCRGYDELYPSQPEWGLTSDRPDLKRYILCCMKNESG